VHFARTFFERIALAAEVTALPVPAMKLMGRVRGGVGVKLGW
jgi:hypothetical protein